MNIEQIYKQKSLIVVEGLIHSLARAWGIERNRILDDPIILKYNADKKSVAYQVGPVGKHSRDHWRRRFIVEFLEMHMTDGESEEVARQIVEIDRETLWSTEVDNRIPSEAMEKVDALGDSPSQHEIEVALGTPSIAEYLSQFRQPQRMKTEELFEEKERYSRFRTLNVLDVALEISASVGGNLMGFTVGSEQSASVKEHNEIEYEKWNRSISKRAWKDEVPIWPPLGELWEVKREVVTRETIRTYRGWGQFDARKIRVNFPDWMGGPLPHGEHKNDFWFDGMDDLLDFARGALELRYAWQSKWTPTKAVRRQIARLEDPATLKIDPITWDDVKVDKGVDKIQPVPITPHD